MADPSLHHALGLLLRDVAARAILPRWQALHAADIAEKAPGDFVTIADHEAEQQLTEALMRLIPGARVVGEEAVAQNPDLLDGLETGLVWLVDPLDGTANFIAGSPHFAVMVALVDNGDVQAGWVYHPARGRLYHAQAGAGAQMNGAPLVAQGSGNSGLVAAFPTRYTPPDQQQVITDLKARVATSLEVAARFSFERGPPVPSLGFHGLFNFPDIFPDRWRKEIADLPLRRLAGRDAWDLGARLISQKRKGARGVLWRILKATLRHNHLGLLGLIRRWGRRG